MSTEQQAPIRRPGAKRPNGAGRAGKRSFDVEDELWQAGLAAAHKRGVSLASVLRTAIAEFVDDVDSSDG